MSCMNRGIEPALAVHFCVAEWQQIEAQSAQEHHRAAISTQELEQLAQYHAWQTAMAQCELERRRAERSAIFRTIKQSCS